MKLRHILALSAALFVLAGCSDDQFKKVLGSLVDAPDATIERDVKGHEQIYAIQAILRMAQASGPDTYTAYDISPKIQPVPVYQEISFDKDDEGKITISSRRKQFDVILSPNFKYTLELKYYDVNGQLINHQFGGYDENDKENSTLLVHQHFFSLQSYSIDGKQLVYPMTLDSLYYDDFLFKTDGSGRPERVTGPTFAGVYVRSDGHEPNKIPYNRQLAERAVSVAMTDEAKEPYTNPQDGKSYLLYKTLGVDALNERVSMVFEYEYRDTDPIESELGSVLSEYDDLGRLRVGERVIRLRQERSLQPGMRLDALGFKGLITFKHPEMAFQMRVCICHIVTPEGKYKKNGESYKYNEISPAWNSFDIDYPIPFRVIANTDDGMEKCLKDINRYYPTAGNEGEIERILSMDQGYFRLLPNKTM